MGLEYLAPPPRYGFGFIYHDSIDSSEPLFGERAPGDELVPSVFYDAAPQDVNLTRTQRLVF